MNRLALDGHGAAVDRTPAEDLKAAQVYFTNCCGSARGPGYNQRGQALDDAMTIREDQRMQGKVISVSAPRSLLATPATPPSPPRKLIDHPAAAAVAAVADAADFGELHYLLPTKLRGLLLRRFDGAEYWRQAMAKEAELERSCGCLTVGLWHGWPLKFPMLCEPAPRVTPDQARRLGWSDENLQAVNRALPQVADAVEQTLGYAGWLVTQRQFVREQKLLFAGCGDAIRRYGAPRLGPAGVNLANVPGVDPAEAGLAECLGRWEAFCHRWHLQALAGPFLPQPLPARQEMPPPWLLMTPVYDAGVLQFHAPVFPAPPRDAARERFAGDRREGDAHLREWSDIVSMNNPSKQQISRYARLFRLQHFWRAIYVPHGAALQRSAGAIINVLAEFLGSTEATLRRDLADVAGRLGGEWWRNDEYL